MEVGRPHSLLTERGEIVFNVLTGDASGDSLSNPGSPPTIWPYGLPEGNGYLMQFISGMHSAPYRNPVDDRPHKHGGIVHKFWHRAKFFTLSGLVIATTPEYRQLLNDELVAYVHSAMQTDSRYFFKPAGLDTRFLTVRNYDAPDILGPAGSPGGSPSGMAGPKQYEAQFVAAFPFAQDYTERDETVALSDSVFVPNDGTREAWPVLKVHGPFDAFTVDNGVYQLAWYGPGFPSGHYIEINMYDETMYKDGNSTNELAGFEDVSSDFWSIPPGGATVTFVGTSSGAPTLDIISNDTWG